MPAWWLEWNWFVPKMCVKDILQKICWMCWFPTCFAACMLHLCRRLTSAADFWTVRAGSVQSSRLPVSHAVCEEKRMEVMWTATTTGKETLVTSPLTLSVPSFLMLYHYPLWFKRGNAETKRFSMWKWSLFNCRFPVSIRFMMISMGFCQNNLTEKPGVATPVGILFHSFNQMTSIVVPSRSLFWVAARQPSYTGKDEIFLMKMVLLWSLMHISIHVWKINISIW